MPKRRKVTPVRRMFNRALIETTLFLENVVGFCTRDELATFAVTCKATLASVVMVLTEQQLWRVSILLNEAKTKWTWTEYPGRMAHVKNIWIDSAVDELPMELTNCDGVLFKEPCYGFPDDYPLLTYSMFPVGVQKVWFKSVVTPGYFEHVDGLPDTVRVVLFERASHLKRGLLPAGVKLLEMVVYTGDLRDVLPLGLEHFRISQYSSTIQPGTLPAGLQGLRVDNGMRIVENALPTGLLSLHVDGPLRLRPANVLTRVTGLKYLTLGRRTNHHRLVQGMLPPNLRCLTVAFRFNHPLDQGVLPRGLKEMVFDSSVVITPGSLPEGLLRLKLGEDFCDLLDANMLPRSLMELEMCSKYVTDWPVEVQDIRVAFPRLEIHVYEASV